MAASNTGGWVRRVGAAGGGKTYRRRRPFNFYGIIVVVVVLGFGSVAWARYKYEHPAAAASATPPTTKDTWYAALGIDVCGRQQPALAPNANLAVTGFAALQGGAIEIKPITSAETGNNSTLALFVSSYSRLAVSKGALVLPIAKPAKHGPRSHTYLAGTACPKGTPDAGKAGSVVIATWRDLGSKRPTLYTSPSAVHFSNSNMLITIAFLPTGTTPPKPPATAIRSMLAPPPPATTTTTLPTTTTTSQVTTTTAKH